MNQRPYRISKLNRESILHKAVILKAQVGCQRRPLGIDPQTGQNSLPRQPKDRR
jgi:hypothetical protein